MTPPDFIINYGIDSINYGKFSNESDPIEFKKNYLFENDIMDACLVSTNRNQTNKKISFIAALIPLT